MKIINIKGSFLLLIINKDSVKCYYFYPLSWFNWIYTKNSFELKELTIKLIVQTYQEIEKENDQRYRV
jgi:tetraacyldisaccharide-1-P 4'-kinase